MKSTLDTGFWGLYHWPTVQLLDVTSTGLGPLTIGLSDLSTEVRHRTVERVVNLEPGTIAILVGGSYAKGTADRFSDLDLVALTAGEPVGGHRTWFESMAGDELHVSTSVREIDEWVSARSEPAEWSLGFPTRLEYLYLFEANGVARERLGDPVVELRPAGPPELEDFVEYVMKVRRAAGRGEEVHLRWHARDAAELAPGLLISLNPETRVGGRLEALDAALNLRVCPEMYREDMLVALGLRACETPEVEASTLRLAANLLEFLKRHKPDVDPEMAQYLKNGTLERRLE